MLDAWAELLRRTGRTRLVLANAALQSIHNRAYVRDQFVQRGVDGERVILEGPAAHFEYLQKHDRLDVALDAFPYNGGTTTMEAIWQGVPVLTLDGDRWAARTSQSILRRTHLSEFVAQDVRGYVEQAVAVARDPTAPARLSHLRRAIRWQLRGSSAWDTPALARAMEATYERCVLEGERCPTRQVTT